MKKIFYFIVLFVLSMSTVSYAADELEGILTRDDSALEKQLTGKSNKAGNVMEGSVDKVVGQALVRNEKEEVWKQAYKGMQIKEGVTLVTMEKSEVKVKLPTGTVVDIRPKTQAVFETLRQDPKKTELTETGIKLIMGKIYSNVKKLAESGSKYEVKTSAATAGVRGTQFLMSANEDGTQGAEVYEGTVECTDESGNIVRVGAGEKVNWNDKGEWGNKEKHSNQPPQDIEEAAFSSAGDTKNESDTRISMEAGSTVVNGTNYASLKIKPDFNHVFGSPIGLGLNITFLQGTQNGGTDTVTRFGPGASEKWYDAVSIRYAEYETEPFGIRYGELDPQTYGQGLLMDSYSTFGLRARVTTGNFSVKGFGPLKEASNTEQDYLYAGRIEVKAYGDMWTGFTYVADTDKRITDDKLDLAKSGMAGDIYMKWTPAFVPYFEYAQLSDSYGQAFATGFRGNAAMINYRLEFRSIGDKYKAGLYDAFYEKDKDNKVYDTANGLSILKKYSGVLAGIGAKFDGIGTASFTYEDYGKDEGKAITLGAEAKIVGRVKAGLYYKQKHIKDNFKIMDKNDPGYINNTIINSYVTYPINPSVDLRLEINKKQYENDYMTFKTIIMF